MTRHIPPLKKDGFTLDGVGYFAGHQESHRILYAKTPWCHWIFVIVLFALAATAATYGLVANAPSVFALGAVILGLMTYYYAPRKKAKKVAPVEEPDPEEATP